MEGADGAGQRCAHASLLPGLFGRGLGVGEATVTLQALVATVQQFLDLEVVDLAQRVAECALHRDALRLAERDALNNHGTCWALQVAVFASFTGNASLVDFCRKRYMQVFIPNQMATDGSFPLELKRTKPYGYSLFNLDIMASLAHVLQVWDWKMSDGRGIQKGIQFLIPFIQDKSKWTYPADVMYYDQ